MSRRSFTLLLTMLVVGVVSGQWSDPVALPYDPLARGYCFIRAPGDTFWALHVHDGVSDSAVAYACWSLGDTWARPESIGESRLAASVGGCEDGKGRLWFLWYDGDVPWRGFEPWCVMAGVREVQGWRFLGNVLLSPGPEWQYVSGLVPAADRSGQVYVGIVEHVHEVSGQYSSARLARMQGDSLTWPWHIVKGDTGANGKWVYELTLVPRQDSGLWSVTSMSCSPGPRVTVHEIWGDTATQLLDFPGDHMDAVGDSDGRLWVVYCTSDDEVRAARIGPGAQVQHFLVSPEIHQRHLSACVDSAGWVWCVWPREESTLVASYNRGLGWSTPETVIAQKTGLSRILADSRGGLHAFYQSSLPRWYWTHRISRPGVAEEESGHRSAIPGPSVVGRILYYLGVVTAELFDLSGRCVMDLKPGPNDIRHLAPGVYFVRRPETEDGRQRTAVRKVIIQR